MFPTIDPCRFTENTWYRASYPDHGEVCRYPMEVGETDTLRFSFRSRLFPVHFSKTISADPDGSLLIHYTLFNQGVCGFPYIWAAHCMLAGSPHGRVLTPFTADAPVRYMFGPENVNALLRDRLEPFAADGATYKFYYTQPVPAGFCCYAFPDTGKRLMLEFPVKEVPYLGVWLNNGGFKGMYNVALEPCTALYDRPDVALEHGCASILEPGESTSFSLRISLQTNEPV